MPARSEGGFERSGRFPGRPEVLDPASARLARLAAAQSQLGTGLKQTWPAYRSVTCPRSRFRLIAPKAPTFPITAATPLHASKIASQEPGGSHHKDYIDLLL